MCSAAAFARAPQNAKRQGGKWAASTGVELPIAGGYFLGPGPDQRAIYGAPPRPTATLLDQVAGTGQVPEITDADRARTAEDLAYWRAGPGGGGPGPNAGGRRGPLRGLPGPAPPWGGGGRV